ncbi:hypothetical protein RUND412_008168 [Rhizina undulata]
MFSFNFTIKSALVAVLFASQALGIPVEKRANTTCTEVLQRKAWHTLTDAEKTKYIDAELCLIWQRPGQTGLDGVVFRYDDFIKLHQLRNDYVHGDGVFLPFHRLLMHAHEHALRTECGYTGAQPYWAEARDTGKFNESVVFFDTVNFGGNGNGTDGVAGCVTDGPFANMTLHIGPGTNDTDHCLKRQFSETASLWSSQVYIDACMANTTYADAWQCMNDKIHQGTHGGVGGQMADVATSPDPVFFLHHTFLDRVWWQWQEEDLETRLTDIAGYTTLYEPATGWVNTTLYFEIDVFGIVPNATVGDIMDVRGSLLCYEYV